MRSKTISMWSVPSERNLPRNWIYQKHRLVALFQLLIPLYRRSAIRVAFATMKTGCEWWQRTKWAWRTSNAKPNNGDEWLNERLQHIIKYMRSDWPSPLLRNHVTFRASQRIIFKFNNLSTKRSFSAECTPEYSDRFFHRFHKHSSIYAPHRFHHHDTHLILELNNSEMSLFIILPSIQSHPIASVGSKQLQTAREHTHSISST